MPCGSFEQSKQIDVSRRDDEEGRRRRMMIDNNKAGVGTEYDMGALSAALGDAMRVEYLVGSLPSLIPSRSSLGKAVHEILYADV